MPAPRKWVDHPLALRIKIMPPMAWRCLKKMFTPEFRNRLDSIIQFDALSPEVIKTVVDKFLVEIQVQFG